MQNQLLKQQLECRIQFQLVANWILHLHFFFRLWDLRHKHWLRVLFLLHIFKQSFNKQTDFTDVSHSPVQPSSREERVGSSGGVKLCYSCSRNLFFFSCRNLADHWDLYFCGFDMKLLNGLSGLCLSIPALKWAWLFSLCSQWPHFSALESADGQLTLQTGHMPSQEQIPLQWWVLI